MTWKSFLAFDSFLRFTRYCYEKRHSKTSKKWRKLQIFISSLPWSENAVSDIKNAIFFGASRQKIAIFRASREKSNSYLAFDFFLTKMRGCRICTLSPPQNGFLRIQTAQNVLLPKQHILCSLNNTNISTFYANQSSQQILCWSNST